MNHCENCGHIPRVKIHPFNLVSRAADALDISISQIRAKNRTRTLVRTRQAIAQVMRDQYGRSYPEIAKDLNQDHSTVIYNIGKSRALANECERHRDLVSRLSEI